MLLVADVLEKIRPKSVWISDKMTIFVATKSWKSVV